MVVAHAPTGGLSHRAVHDRALAAFGRRSVLFVLHVYRKKVAVVSAKLQPATGRGVRLRSRFGKLFQGCGSFDENAMDAPTNPPTTIKPATLWRVWRLLTPGERKHSTLVLLALALNSLVDLFGLAAVLPVIQMVVQPAELQGNPFFREILAFAAEWGIETPREVLLALTGCMVVAFLVKAAIGLAVTGLLSRFSFSIAHRLSGDMWRVHFEAPSTGLWATDTGKVLAEINAWPFLFANTFLAGGLLALSEVATVALIATVLVVYNPVVFVSVALLLGTGVLFIRMATRKRLSRYSALRNRVEPSTNSLIADAIRGHLEILSFRAGDAIRSAYLRDRKVVLDTAAATAVIGIVPAKVYEVLAVLAIAGAIGVSILADSASSGFVGVLSLLALSAYRAMPSLSRISGALLAMRGHMHVLEALEPTTALPFFSRNIPSAAGGEGPPLDGPVEIELDAIALRHEHAEGVFLANVQATFAPGHLHAIVGPSGSGKSSLMRTLLGLHVPAAGSVRIRTAEGVYVLGEELTATHWLGHCAYVSQHPFLFRGTVADNLTLRVPELQVDAERAEAWVRRLGLEGCLGPDPLRFVLSEGGSNLSGGQQQRLALLRALHLNRPVLLVDEVTSALDPALREDVLAVLREEADRGVTVLVVTHDSDLAAACDTHVNLAHYTPPSPGWNPS